MGRPIFSPGYYAAEALHHQASLADSLSNTGSWDTGNRKDAGYTTPPSPSTSDTSRDGDEPVIERFLDPTDPLALSITLDGLTSGLTPLARSYVLALPSDVLHRATSFEETVSRDGLLTISIFRSSTIIGLCQTRVSTEREEEDESLDSLGEPTRRSPSETEAARRQSERAAAARESMQLPDSYLRRVGLQRISPSSANEEEATSNAHGTGARPVRDYARPAPTTGSMSLPDSYLERVGLGRRIPANRNEAARLLQEDQARRGIEEAAANAHREMMGGMGR